MKSASPEQVLFAEALQRATPETRAAYLDAACGTDTALRRRLEVLLRAAESAGDFLEEPPTGLSGDVDSSQFVTERISEKPGDRIGRYKLLEKIGEGGCGVVYMAEQEEPVRRRVALKVIKLGMDTRSVVARFEAERQALALMDHPNIAKVLDGGTTQTGRPYFVMELVRGVRITEFCDEARLTTEARLRLFVQVCQAIQHAHQKGIIHRDLKPSNILVTVNDGAPVPKVIDFGIAKATGQRLTDKTLFTQFHSFIGTPAYTSPEQAEMSSVDIDTRSDIYSLGVLLYELLTGQTPFDGEQMLRSGLDEMRRIIRDDQPPRPSMRLTQELERANHAKFPVHESPYRSAGWQPAVSPTGSRQATEMSHACGLPIRDPADCQSALRFKGAAGEEPAITRASSRRLLLTKELISAVRGDLDWIVMKCLEKDRARRYETVNGLAADLKRHLDNEPVVARPPSAATAVAVALVAGIGFSTWQTFAARKPQRATELARNGDRQQRLAAQSAQKVADTERQKSRRLLYASDMNLAQQTLQLHNLGKARRLLDRHRPQPGEEDLRGWEWRYLWQLTRSSALVTLTNRPTRGFSVSFSPDGTRLAVGWWGGRVDLWDVPRRRPVRALTEREYLHQGRVVFSPVRDLLAATSEPKVVALYDLDSGRESILWRAPDQGVWQVRDLAFSQDGSRLVIYAGSTPEFGDSVWVVNVSSLQIESRHSTVFSGNYHIGTARLSTDNRCIYLARSDTLNYGYSIQCVDLATGKELWQTERERDLGLTTLAISPEGRVLASGSGFEDPTIRIWEAGTGRLLRRLAGHTGWVCKLAFTKDGRRLISAASDQSIRFWDTSNWTETQVLCGHTDAVFAVANSELAQLVASASRDGDLMLWKDDGKSATDGYRRLPENLRDNQILPLDQSRVLLLPPGQPPELVDLQHDSRSVSLPEISSSTDVLGWFGTNILCHWNGSNQILVSELRGAELIQRGAVALDPGMRPTGFAYNATRQLLAWTEGTSSNSVYLESLAAPGRRIELRSDVPGIVPFRFSEDGNFLVAVTAEGDSLRAWNIETGRIVASSGGLFGDAIFADDERVLVVAIELGNNHEIIFYDLVHPDRAPRRVPGRSWSQSLAISPDRGLVASSTIGGLVRLFNPASGSLIGDPLHGHLRSASGVAFSADGRRLISTSGAEEAVKLWDVGTRQELLTLSGTGSRLDAARWSADGDVIMAGAPWQAWRAPSWEEIASAEAKEKTEIKQP